MHTVAVFKNEPRLHQKLSSIKIFLFSQFITNKLPPTIFYNLEEFVKSICPLPTLKCVF